MPLLKNSFFYCVAGTPPVWISMSAKNQKNIRAYFLSNDKDDYVKNYLLERITDETGGTGKQDKVEETVDVNVDIDFYKNKVSALEIENSKLKKDNKDLKKLLNKSNQVNLHKDLLIKQLKKQINENNSSSINSSSQNKKQKILFDQFENKIDRSDLITLRSINDKKEKDSSFVLKCLHILYKNDLTVLNKRCATKTKPTKQELTPDKKSIINELFFERLSSMNLCPEDEQERKLRFRYLLSNAISNSVIKTTNTSTDPVANTSVTTKP